MPTSCPFRPAGFVWRVLAAVCCLAVLCWLAAPAAGAQADLDTIHRYTVTVDPRADGTADITYDIDWEVIGGSREEPLSWVQIGLPNDRVDGFVNRTPDTVSSVRYRSRRGSSFAQVVFVKRYYAPDYAAAAGQESRVRFAFTVHQSGLFTLEPDGTARYAFTPGWFDDLSIEDLTVRWKAADGMTADADAQEDGYFVWHFGALGHGERATVRVQVPAALAAGFDPNAALAARRAVPLAVWFGLSALLVAAALALFGFVRARSHPRWRCGSPAADWDFYRRGRHTLRLPHGAPPPAGWQKTAAPHGMPGGRMRGVHAMTTPNLRCCAGAAAEAAGGKKSAAITLPER